jgi:hypothetical protein
VSLSLGLFACWHAIRRGFRARLARGRDCPARRPQDRAAQFTAAAMLCAIRRFRLFHDSDEVVPEVLQGRGVA